MDHLLQNNVSPCFVLGLFHENFALVAGRCPAAYYIAEEHDANVMDAFFQDQHSVMTEVFPDLSPVVNDQAAVYPHLVIEGTEAPGIRLGNLEIALALRGEEMGILHIGMEGVEFGNPADVVQFTGSPDGVKRDVVRNGKSSGRVTDGEFAGELRRMKGGNGLHLLEGDRTLGAQLAIGRQAGDAQHADFMQCPK